jgi:hypothetical protein
MKFEITYLKQKKKGYAKQSAVFLKIEDCFFWQSIIEKQGAKDIIITPK